MCWLIAGWARWSWRAALDILPALATATKLRRWCSSTVCGVYPSRWRRRGDGHRVASCLIASGSMPTLESYARFPLLFGPSPIQKLERLTKDLGGATIWAKREDMNSPYVLGGNKTRRLEYLEADALARCSRFGTR